MAIALPVYEADGTFSAPRLPAYTADGTFVTGNIKLPLYVFDAYRSDFFLPRPALGLIYFELTPTGGIFFGGNAEIVGDPMLPTGGFRWSGTSPVSHWPAPTGGIRFSGTAVVGVLYGPEVPVGGMLLGGTAEVTTSSALITPTGGMVFGGSAVVQENIPFIVSGGMRWNGAVDPITAYAPPASGGVVFGGTVTPVTKYVPVPEGGIVFNGTSPVTFRESIFFPSGGFAIGGSATAYMVDSNTVVTPENPYGDPFPGWMVNVENNAASRYLGLPANSITQFGGKTYVANAAGVYEITGDADAGQPIKSSVEFPTTDFQDSHEKRMEVAYVGIKTIGRMKLKLMVNGYAPLYFFLMPSSDKHKGTRIPIGKGMVGRYWGARIDNVKGCDFSIDSAEFKPVAGQRHGA